MQADNAYQQQKVRMACATKPNQENETLTLAAHDIHPQHLRQALLPVDICALLHLGKVLVFLGEHPYALYLDFHLGFYFDFLDFLDEHPGAIHLLFYELAQVLEHPLLCLQLWHYHQTSEQRSQMTSLQVHLLKIASS